MADRNRSDLDREQRGASNPNQTERPEDRSTSSHESGVGGGMNKPNQKRDQGVGSESEDRGEGNLGSDRSNREGNLSSGNIEGDENPNRR